MLLLAPECDALSGRKSGTCAQSFGVCCIFSINCGASSKENNTFAIKDSFSFSTDADPCTYTFCKANSDVCKLKIEFDLLVLEGPGRISTPAAPEDSPLVGDCLTDTLTIAIPGAQSPPTICGYNTNQHIFVPASDLCNTVSIDIDTGTTTTTRHWKMRVLFFKTNLKLS